MKLHCGIRKIKDLEVFSDGKRKVTVLVDVFEWNRVQKFEIHFYNKYIAETENLRIGSHYEIECLLRSENFEDEYYTHIVGLSAKFLKTF